MIDSIKKFYEIYENTDTNISSLVIRTEIREDIIFELLDNSPELKTVIAKNKYLSERVITVLSEDVDSDVRYWIAMKRSAPINVLKKLALDDSEDVRRRVVNNSKATKDVLSQMANDSVEDIALKAKSRISSKI